jgi:hypothetical protein
VLIIGTEVEQAESELSKGTSPFHKLGRATALFLRATLGFEKEVMEQAGAWIAEAEESALEYQRRAQRNPSSAHQSKIYPPGAEYALCHAEAQLMSAVIAVLNESLTESLKGFYKLRKAFWTLHEIDEAEQAYLRKRGKPGSQYTSSNTSSTSKLSTGNDSGVLTPTSGSSEDEDEDDDLAFVDAEEKVADLHITEGYQGNLEQSDATSTNLDETVTEKLATEIIESTSIPVSTSNDSGTSVDDQLRDIDFRTISTNPIDLFIHSGNGLCYGLLQLLLSMIPPAFGRLLSLFSFRGDREAGLRLLWSATKFNRNINGAMAGLITLGFHNAAIAFCDILANDALPDARLRTLLAEMRELYPKSKLWLLEEARILARDRKLEQGVKLLSSAPESSLKQIEALAQFEMSLSLLYLHQFEECAASFIKTVSMNNWSHGMYYYIAGACYVELYRTVKDTDQEKAKAYASKAEGYLHEVPLHTGKKRFMARQLPFDVYITRKLAKWEARSKARGCTLIDAIGVSPAIEMMYFWSGFRRMRPEQIQACLDRLSWSENTSMNPHWTNEPADEKAVLGLLRASCQRFLPEIDQAQKTLEIEVFSHELHHLKACEHADTWPLPTGHYENAVCYWNKAGGESGDKALIQKCSDELTKVENWESFELEARIGLKVRTARETLKRAQA